VYVNAGLLLVFGGLLTGVFGGRESGWGTWLAALVPVAAGVAAASFRAKRTLPFALAVVAAWLGLQRLVVEGAGREPVGALLLSAITAAAALVLIVSAHRKMRVR
jgi:hypothetical protein